MDASTIRELADILLRWVHLIAGIMWIGNSMLWNWLDRNLIKDADKNELHLGRIWLLHSGAFYEMEKKLLGPGQMPKVLHWFKWQSYTTWLTGFSLLVLLYWSDGASLTINPSVMRLTQVQATLIGAGVVFGGFAIYDLTWRLLHRFERVAMAITLLLLAGVVWGLPQVFSGRAAFIHVGAMLGTCMSGNVFLHIIPSQRKLVAATQAGRAQDPADSIHAKQRSIHNNYLTFPLLFTMLSNHFSSITGSAVASSLLGVFIVCGALSRHWLNIRFTFGPWMPALRRRSSRRSAWWGTSSCATSRRRCRPRRAARPSPSRRSSSSCRAAAPPATPTTRPSSRTPRPVRRPLRHAGGARHVARAHQGAGRRHEDDAAEQPHRDDRGGAGDRGAVGDAGRGEQVGRRPG